MFGKHIRSTPQNNQEAMQAFNQMILNRLHELPSEKLVEIWNRYVNKTHIEKYLLIYTATIDHIDQQFKGHLLDYLSKKVDLTKYKYFIYSSFSNILEYGDDPLEFKEFNARLLALWLAKDPDTLQGFKHLIIRPSPQELILEQIKSKLTNDEFVAIWNAKIAYSGDENHADKIILPVTPKNIEKTFNNDLQAYLNFVRDGNLMNYNYYAFSPTEGKVESNNDPRHFWFVGMPELSHWLAGDVDLRGFKDLFDFNDY